MNIFRFDKAPYVLGLLVTVIGWHISQLVNEISTTQAVSYSLDVDRQTREVSALIRNVSRTKSLIDATFSLECADAASCFEPFYEPATGELPTYGKIESIAPNAGSRQNLLDSPIFVQATNTVAAGGRYRIRARLANSHADAKVNFFFIPNPDPNQRPLDIYLYKRDTIGGLFVENYLGILGISLVFCVIALIYSLIWGPMAAAPAETGARDGN